MKRVLFVLLALIGLAMSAPAFAIQQQQQPSDTEQLLTTVTKLDADQKAKLLDAAQHIQKGDTAVSQTKEWVDIGASLGQALASTAKEMNIAVNDFAKSPVGKLAIGLIIWKMLGGAIIHFLGALFCFFLLLCWYRLFRNMYGVWSDDKKKLIKIKLEDTFAAFMMGVMGIAFFICGFVAILTA